MDILNRKFGWLAMVAIFMSYSVPIWAEEKGLAQPPPKVASLLASPGICELPDDAISCEMTVNFIWELPSASEVCLWDSHIETPLKCWNGMLTSTWQVTFTGGKDREFWLKTSHSDTLLARTSIRVIGAIEQRLRARRRQGFWRIF